MDEIEMKRTILIPTDFSPASLDVAEHVIAAAGEESLDIVLTHCTLLPDSISELLFFSKEELIRSLRPPEFNKASRAMLNRHANKNVAIVTDLFTGWNQSAFNLFLEGNRIEEAVIPNPYKPELNLERSFDPIPFIRKSALKITEIELCHSNRFLFDQEGYIDENHRKNYWRLA
jgi:hypothetical protein